MPERTHPLKVAEGADAPTLLPAQEYLDADDLARRYKASARSIFRWADAGRMPPGTKIGTLRRWSRRDVEKWEAGGCQPFRVAGAATR